MARIDKMIASPLGTVASGISGLFGASQRTQDAGLDTVGALEGVAGSVTGTYKQTLAAQAPSALAASRVRTGATTPSWKTAADNEIFTGRTSWSATRPRGTQQTYDMVQRNDIDWSQVRTSGPADFIGRTNADAANRGFSPQLADDSFATLHHVGQDSRGSLAEASTRYHGVGKPGQDALHSLYGNNEPGADI